jgi:lipid II isoglutaminyl synthase (glutamine-hydrolysing)
VTRRRVLRIVDVYPGSMFPQGDGGNLRMLEYRARGREIDVETVPAPIGEPLPQGDLYVLQGAEDEDQPVVARRLAEEGTLAGAAAAGKVVVGIGAGYQILGRSFEAPDGTNTEGLGLLDVRTTLGEHVDNRVVTRPALRLGLPALVGYEWHRGRTALGPEAEPLAEVEVGVCNGGEPPTDGAVQGHVLGTYLHGPLLPRNPELADLLLCWVLGRELDPLASEFAERARQERIAEAREVERRKRGLLGRFR